MKLPNVSSEESTRSEVDTHKGHQELRRTTEFSRSNIPDEVRMEGVGHHCSRVCVGLRGRARGLELKAPRCSQFPLRVEGEGVGDMWLVGDG